MNNEIFTDQITKIWDNEMDRIWGDLETKGQTYLDPSLLAYPLVIKAVEKMADDYGVVVVTSTFYNELIGNVTKLYLRNMGDMT